MYRSTEPSGDLQTQAEHYAARLLAAIQEDIASGLVAATVRSFADVGEYVDCADYDGAVGWSVCDEPRTFDDAIAITDSLLPLYADLAADSTATAVAGPVAEAAAAVLRPVLPARTARTAVPGWTDCPPATVADLAHEAYRSPASLAAEKARGQGAAVPSLPRRAWRAVRIGLKAARILATSKALPLPLRILLVIGCIQIPVLPVDEIALAIALAWLALRHRGTLAAAFATARAEVQA
jgi:hypothetical protein